MPGAASEAGPVRFRLFFLFWFRKPEPAELDVVRPIQ
jgi:hypothetical protein